MCGRYFIEPEDDEDDLLEIINILQRSGAAVRTGEISPGDAVPVVANNRKMFPQPFVMPWGFRMAEGKLVFNARSESAAEKQMFRDGMLQRRCMVPASYYFEWEKSRGGKVKHAIRPSAGGTLWMAGIYRLEGTTPRFTILTREVAQNIAHIHDRMPVILPQAAARDWLNPKYDAGDVLRYAVTDVTFAPVEGAVQIVCIDA